MQAQMNALGYKNVFIGTVEGEPEETDCENVIELSRPPVTPRSSCVP